MDKNHIQALVDGLGAAEQRMRAASGQMTLGKLIAELEKYDGNMPIEGLGRLHSYRGYYSDLALEELPEPTVVHELLTECRSAMGKVFTGYKGGDFQMGESTPMWISEYGDNSGMKLIGLVYEESNKPGSGILVPVTEEEVWL